MSSTTAIADCAWYRELASGEIDGEVSPDEGAALGQHLEACRACRDLHRRVRRVVRLVRTLLRWREVTA